MPHPFIRKLLKIFNLKEEILEQLKKLVDPIDEIVHDFGKVWGDEYEDMVLKHRPFHEDTGFLPLVNKLIQANNELVHYQDDKDTVSIKDEFGVNMSENLAHCGLEIHREYLRMMALVKQEQYYLVKWFRPTLQQISKRENYKEAWKQHLEHFGILVDVLEKDLKFADILQESLGQRGFLDYLKKPTKEEIEKNKPIIANNVVKSLEQNDLNGAIYWIKYGRNHEWLDEEETRLLNNLMLFIQQQNVQHLEQLIKSEIFRKIFNAEEIEFFQRLLAKLSPKPEPEIDPLDLAFALVREAQQLGELEEIEFPDLTKLKDEDLSDIPIPPEIGLPDILDIPLTIERKVSDFDVLIKRVKGEILVTIVELKEAYPEVEKIPEIKKLRISQLRLKTRFRLLARKLKRGYKNNKELLLKGLSVLKQSIQFRKWISDYVRAIKSSRAYRYISEKGVYRRKLLIGVATTGIMGGAAYLATRKKSEIKSKEGPKIEPQYQKVEATDLKFDPVTIPEVNKIIYTEGSYKNASYIVVIPHSSELNALVAARAVAKGPITYVAGNNDRNLKIKTYRATVQIDPNNSFCIPGIVTCFEFLNGRWNSLERETQDYMIGVIQKFTNEVSRRIFVGKMVLALHQNTKAGFGIKSYKNETRFSRHAAEIFINPSESNDVFAYVNTKGWFEVLKAKGWNVVLQGNKREYDDGSISYASTWQSLPYINIEVELGTATKQAKMIRAVNALIEQYPLLKSSMDYDPFSEGGSITQSKIFRLLVIGSDLALGKESGGERGDSLLLITTDSNQKVIRILTIPRDTYININGKYTKINHALAYGGWQLQKKSIEEILGISIDKVFFLNRNNLWRIVQEVNNNNKNDDIKRDILLKVGVKDTVITGYQEFMHFISKRNYADAAVGRAKNHAKILAACIQTIKEYYKDTSKKNLFEEQTVRRLISLVKYTNLTFQDVNFLVNEWSSNEYKIEIYCIPGKSQTINGASYWIPENISGVEDYFTRVVNYSKSRIA